MRAAFAVAAVVLAGCRFEHGAAGAQAGDALVDSDVRDDAAMDDASSDAALDARACPSAPANCMAFTCGSSPTCYYVCGDATAGSKKGWGPARDACAAIGDGACIATIDDQAEQDCIVQKAMPSFPDANWIWFGYHQMPGTGEPLDGWEWECGSSAFTQAPWGSGSTGSEPNQGGEEDCAAMTTDGGWFDASCGDRARYLCELP